MDSKMAASTPWRDVPRRLGPFAVLYASFAWVVTYPVLRHLQAACYWYYDLGIYAEAVARLRWANPNPWLTGRHIRIFNDHFDPIIGLVVPLAQWVGEARALVLSDSLSVVVATLPLLYLWRVGRLTQANACLAVAIVLFHPAVMLALEWPAHPTTWAIAPAMFLGTAMVLERDRAACIALLALLCCKEEFVYVGLCLAVWFVARRKRAWGAGVGALCVAWLAWVFVGRALAFGPTMNYTQKFTQDIWTNPFAAFVDRLSAANLPFEATSAAVIFGALALWAYRTRQAPSWAVLTLCLPILGIRFIAKMWGFQYDAVTVGLCVAAFLPVLMRQRVPTFCVLFIVAALGVLNAHKVVTDWPLAPRDKMHSLEYCPQNRERLVSLAQGFALAMQHDGPLLAEQNLMASIASHPALYQLDGPQSSEQIYDAVLFEKPPNGIAWRFTGEMISMQLATWRAQSHQVLLDDAYVFYARGHFQAPVFNAAAPVGRPNCP